MSRFSLKCRIWVLLQITVQHLQRNSNWKAFLEVCYFANDNSASSLIACNCEDAAEITHEYLSIFQVMCAPQNNQLMIHFPNPANRNKWSTQWDLIEMHNCIVTHTRFHANAPPRIRTPSLSFSQTDLHYTLILCTHKCTDKINWWTGRDTETQTSILTPKHAAHTK